jgi:hypothetical protein
MWEPRRLTTLVGFHSLLHGELYLHLFRYLSHISVAENGRFSDSIFHLLYKYYIGHYSLTMLLWFE